MSMCICAVWINEHIILSLVDNGDDDIKEYEEIYKGRFYADDDEDIGPLGDSVTTCQLTWSRRVTLVRDRISKMWTVKRGITVDSGAADHVMPIGWIAFLVKMVSARSLRALHYVAANGLRIPNEGQQLLKFMSKEGVIAALTFQMAKVNKPLESVPKLIDDDYRVVFDKTGSFILIK